MSLILNIDTATEKASVCLAKNGKQLSLMHNERQQDHASWLHTAIEEMFQQEKYEMKDLNAVAVSAGPGSYTGLRVGMAAAKGFCYALNIPLITENTLFIMAFAATQQSKNKNVLYCPMIDARRMEVFSALYNDELKEIILPAAIILNEESFDDYLIDNSIIFFGSGSEKWRQITKHANAFFANIEVDASYLSILSYKKFAEKKFTDIIYCEPIYIKEFYTHPNK
jgi:tRNA threonylcarbamoyladenosine biosynthesis protein TsaB